MKQQLFHVTKATLSSLLCALMSLPTWAFESGSTGADGVLAPTEDTTLTVPVSGLLQYESVNIPTGVTVRFIDDTTVPGNPPLNILVQGDAVINGTIDLRGANGDLPFTTALPPGGFAGGVLQSTQGGPGQGPGGSAGGDDGGNGGTYAARGASGRNNGSYLGPIYGSESLQPLIGGSGGGSVARRPNVPLNVFLQGGSGGGAMLLAVSGTLSHNGSILATGGLGAPLSSTANVTDATGGGSGGAIRLVASTLTGSGSLDVSGGPGGIGTVNRGGAGGHGRTRLEADRFEFVGSVIPAQISSFDIALPQPIFPANLPTVRISTVAGSAVPANPTGVNDVALPSSISNPVTIEFATTQVPLGSTIALTVTPAVPAP